MNDKEMADFIFTNTEEPSISGAIPTIQAHPHLHHLVSRSNCHNDSLSSLFDDCLTADVAMEEETTVVVNTTDPTPSSAVAVMGPLLGQCTVGDTMEGLTPPVDYDTMWTASEWDEMVYFRTSKGYLGVPKQAALKALTAQDSQLNEPITAALIPDNDEDDDVDLDRESPQEAFWLGREEVIKGDQLGPSNCSSSIVTNLGPETGVEEDGFPRLIEETVYEDNYRCDLLQQAARAAGLENFNYTPPVTDSSSDILQDLVYFDNEGFPHLIQPPIQSPPKNLGPLETDEWRDNIPSFDRVKERRPERIVKKGGWPLGFPRRFPFGRIHPPKTPPHAYHLFIMDNRDQMKNVYKLKPDAFQKVMSTMWKAIPPEKKQYYVNLAAEKKAVYREQMQQFQRRFLQLRDEILTRDQAANIQHTDLSLQCRIENIGPNLYCEICNMHFVRLHNKYEHIKSKAHQKRIEAVTSKLDDIRRKKSSVTPSDPSTSTIIPPAPSQLNTITADLPSFDGLSCGSPDQDIASCIRTSTKFITQQFKARDVEIEVLREYVSDLTTKRDALLERKRKLEREEFLRSLVGVDIAKKRNQLITRMDLLVPKGGLSRGRPKTIYTAPVGRPKVSKIKPTEDLLGRTLYFRVKGDEFKQIIF